MTRLRHVTKPQWLRRGRLLHVIVACGVLVVVGTTALRAQVTFDRILRGDTDKQDWLTYSGSPTGQRHSPLTQITPDNVKNLELQWVFQVRSLEKFEATPLVVDGVMYTVQAPNDVIALDAATGRVFWVYPYITSPLSRLCCGRVNRGLAILENTLYMATIDGHLLAIDAKTGGLVWNVAVSGARAEAGYSFTTAPLIVKDKVDRKSTRLNSSHLGISYAVFCLKK